ncbi:MAG: potassium transporter TrkG [Mobilitalea sp.]
MSTFKLSKTVKSIDRLIRKSPAKMIFCGFALLILIGAILLSLPVSTRDGNCTSFITALFTATSSVCVTGMVVVDTNTYWSLFGKIVILLLVQIGALGIMSVVTLLSVIMGKNLDLSQRMAIKESISNFSLENVVFIFKRILKMMMIMEGLGAVLTSIDLIPMYGVVEGIAKSIFHSISSFCNAGFDVFGTDSENFIGLTNYSSNFLFILTTSILIIAGGLGFIVWQDITKVRRFSRFTLQTKIVLIMTLILIVSGTILIMVFEKDNTMRELPGHLSFLNSFFHAVSSRTAGFGTVPIHEMSTLSIFITMLLMFIGGAPGSTAGGIKVTTLFVLIATVVSFLKGNSEVQILKRRITADIIMKAVSIFMLSLTLITLTTIVLLINKEGSLLQVLFEAVSAFSTAGASTEITPYLKDSSKYQLIITMFLGRVGIITTFAAFNARSGKDRIGYRYPEGKLTVG